MGTKHTDGRSEWKHETEKAKANNKENVGHGSQRASFGVST